MEKFKFILVTGNKIMGNLDDYQLTIARAIIHLLNGEMDLEEVTKTLNDNMESINKEVSIEKLDPMSFGVEYEVEIKEKMVESERNRQGFIKIYKLIEEREAKVNYWQDRTQVPGQKRDFILSFLKENNLPETDEFVVAMTKKLTELKNGSLQKMLKKQGFKKGKVNQVLDNAYDFTERFHMKLHEDLIQTLKKDEILSPAWILIVDHFNRVGRHWTNLHRVWEKYLIKELNPNLIKEHGSVEAAKTWIEQNDLMDLGHNGKIADRTYSVLLKVQEGQYISVSYETVFWDEIVKIADAVNTFIHDLEAVVDSEFKERDEWANYLKAIHEAILEKDPNKGVERWAEVDRRWMKITTPIQPVHPLEYYEDKLRKAVACEWDLRIADVTLPEDKIIPKVEEFFKEFAKEIELSEDSEVYKCTLKNLKTIQLYKGLPVLYYGSHLNGLCSAQVVPNDTVVSKEAGKKVFAFPDRILGIQQAKPITKFMTTVFPREFLDKILKLRFKDKKRWNDIYDWSTVGHEAGHMIGKDETTEAEMDGSGCFKLVEEWLATVGGLLAAFRFAEEELHEDLMVDYIERTVKLMTWRDDDEVEAYYCEGLIHMQILIDSGVLVFNENKFEVNLEKTKYFKTLLMGAYRILIKEYLNKTDAKDFLNKFAIKQKTEYYLPAKNNAEKPVNWIYDKFVELDDIIDPSIKKENYI